MANRQGRNRIWGGRRESPDAMIDFNQIENAFFSESADLLPTVCRRCSALSSNQSSPHPWQCHCGPTTKQDSVCPRLTDCCDSDHVFGKSARRATAKLPTQKRTQAVLCHIPAPADDLDSMATAIARIHSERIHALLVRREILKEETHNSVFFVSSFAYAVQLRSENEGLGREV